MSKLYKTTDYTVFEMHEFNRDVNKTKDLERSMKAHGFIPAYPLHVVRNGGGQLKVKAGHHRLTVAQRLNIPVYYVVCDDAASIHELEKGTVGWSMSDYLTSYCRVGLPDYLEVRRYCAETGISITQAISMLGGQAAGSGNLNNLFKDGKFKIKSRTHADQVAEIVLHMKSCGVSFCNYRSLVAAISKALYVPEVNAKQFMMKIKSHTYLITKQPNVQEYLKVLEELYNRQSKEKIPVAFLADEMAKSRNLIGMNKPQTPSPRSGGRSVARPTSIAAMAR
jgi:hypothetical protein